MAKTATIANVIKAIKKSDLESLQSYLETDKSLPQKVIDDTDKNNKKLIHLIAEDLHDESETDTNSVLELLIKYGADINEPDNKPEGFTLLNICAMHNLQNLALSCLESGANIYADNAESAIETALSHGNTEFARMLVKQEGEIKNHVVAAGLGEIDSLDDFFDNSYNLRISEEQLIEYGTMEMTKALVKPFVMACKNGQMESVFFLFKRGADINLYILHDEDENILEASGLHWAAKYGHYELVKFLINYGAKIHSKDTRFNQTPGQWAQEAGHDQIHKYISYLQKL